ETEAAEHGCQCHAHLIESSRRDRPHDKIVELLRRMVQEVIRQPDAVEAATPRKFEVGTPVQAVTHAEFQLEIAQRGADNKRTSRRRLKARLDAVKAERLDLFNAPWQIIEPDEHIDVIVWTRDSPVEQRVLRVSAEQKHGRIENHESPNEVK